MKINQEGENCARCGEGKGDCETNSTDTTFIVQEIDKQIRHHKGEGNNPAVRSLEYIKGVVENA